MRILFTVKEYPVATFEVGDAWYTKDYLDSGDSENGIPCLEFSSIADGECTDTLVIVGVHEQAAEQMICRIYETEKLDVRAYAETALLNPEEHEVKELYNSMTGRKDSDWVSRLLKM